MQRAAELCRQGDIDAVRTLDQQGQLQSMMQKTDEDGRTLLHGAAASGNLALVDLLVQRGAAQSVNAADDEVGARQKSHPLQLQLGDREHA